MLLCKINALYTKKNHSLDKTFFNHYHFCKRQYLDTLHTKYRVVLVIDPVFSNKECFSKIQTKLQSTIRNLSSFLSNHSLCIKNICEKGKNAFDRSKIYLNMVAFLKLEKSNYNIIAIG